MHIEFQNHAAALLKASEVQPAVWQMAEGDVGQVLDTDVALEEPVSQAVLILRADGTATLFLP